MSKDTVLSVILRLRDEMGGQAKKALDAITQAARGTAQGAGASARAVGALDRAARGAAVSAGATAKGLGEMNRAAGGLRSDRIAGAARSASRLGREAKGAGRELDRAAKSGEKLERSLTRAGGAGRAALSAMRGVGQVGAGVAAGAMVAGRALAKPMDFDQRLALMANTAFSDRNAAGRIKGKKELEASVNAAVRQGGGTRESAAEALDSMLASGAIKTGDAKSLLPVIQKFATGSGAQSSEIAEILIRGIQNKFFNADQAGEALDKALAAGQAGGFELKDMAKWLPKMMAMGSGMKGMAGYEQLLSYAQAAATTAGSKDEAGNNLVNLLQKINSQDTQKDFKKLGIDLTGTLVKAREHGVLPLEAFVDLVEKRVMGKDKRYQALKKKLEKAVGSDRAQILNDMADLAGASAVGKVVQDRQALLALIAGANQKDYIKDVQGRMAGSAGAGETSFAVVQDSAAAKVQGAKNEFDAAMSRTLDAISGPLKGVLDAATGLARDFPTLTTAVVAATTAITAMGASAAAFGAMRMFAGGGAGGAGAGAAAMLAGGKGLLGRMGGPLATAGFAAYDIYATESNEALTRAQKNAQHAENAGGLAGAIAGAKMGAGLGAAGGAAFAGIGAAPGALLGGIAGGALGWWSGSGAGRWLGDKMWGPSSESVNAAKEMIIKDQSVINLESKLILDGREIARAVNTHNAAEAKRH